MPWAAPTPCREPGCRAMATSAGRCDQHRRQQRKDMDSRRPNAAARGYCSARWKRLRLLVLHRDPVCRWPGCQSPSQEVDHITPKSRGGDDSMDNLQGLCRIHHSAKTVAHDGGFGRGR